MSSSYVSVIGYGTYFFKHRVNVIVNSKLMSMFATPNFGNFSDFERFHCQVPVPVPVREYKLEHY